MYNDILFTITTYGPLRLTDKLLTANPVANTNHDSFCAIMQTFLPVRRAVTQENTYSSIHLLSVT